MISLLSLMDLFSLKSPGEFFPFSNNLNSFKFEVNSFSMESPLF